MANVTPSFGAARLILPTLKLLPLYTRWRYKRLRFNSVYVARGSFGCKLIQRGGFIHGVSTATPFCAMQYIECALVAGESISTFRGQ